MSSLISILGAVSAVFLVVLIHEAGHFFTARFLGVSVSRFAIGFGRAIWRVVSKKTGVEYVLGWLPLGGYVKFHDPQPLSDDAQSVSGPRLPFSSQPIVKRMLIVLAGPVVNILLAVCVLWGLYLHGIISIAPIVGGVKSASPAAKAEFKNGDLILEINNSATPTWRRVGMELVRSVSKKGNVSVLVERKEGQLRQLSLDTSAIHWDKIRLTLLEDLGLTPAYPTIQPLIAKVDPSGPAHDAGIRAGDRITALNKKPINNWMSLAEFITNRPGQRVDVEIDRSGERLLIPIRLGQKQMGGQQVGFAGIQSFPPKFPPRLLRRERYNAWPAWQAATQRAMDLIKVKFILLYQLITRELPVQVMGGPISVFQTAGQAASRGWETYWQFFALISLSIGVVNLLPIPGLDGGHFFFLLVECVVKQRYLAQARVVLTALGMLFLLLVILVFSYFDVLRLLSG